MHLLKLAELQGGLNLLRSFEYWLTEHIPCTQEEKGRGQLGLYQFLGELENLQVAPQHQTNYTTSRSQHTDQKSQTRPLENTLQ